MAAAAAISLVLAACGGGSDEPRTINVPADEPTIQAAVDAANPGDLILIAEGTYNEQIIVETEDLVIRGADRNAVFLDGDDDLFDGFLVVADGVAIENLTVRDFRQNGVIFIGDVNYSTDDSPAVTEPLERYRVSYVTSINNGTYGIYAFAARGGLIEHTYASGSPDSGFYIGQCKPCDVVLDDVTAERNSIGYYGTNASGGVFVVNSVFRNNRLGVTPNSQVVELLAPQEGAVIAGNLVVDNDDPTAPAIDGGFFGGGIAVGGGIDNHILRNRVEGHDGFGIGLLPLDGFGASDNRIEGNVVSGNTLDLVVDTESDAAGNCFVSNEFSVEEPSQVSGALQCGDTPGDIVTSTYVGPVPPPPVDYREVAEPGPQPTMPDALTAPATPAGEPPVVDLDSIQVPAPA